MTIVGSCDKKLVAPIWLPTTRLIAWVIAGLIVVGNVVFQQGVRLRSYWRIRRHALGRVVAVLPELGNADNDRSVAEWRHPARYGSANAFSHLRLAKK
jgi:hypothetical protein